METLGIKEDNSIENIFKRQLPEGFYKKVFLNISHAEFIVKHRCQSRFFNEITSLRSATLIKERPGRRCFSVNFVKFLRTPISQNTSV